MLYFHIRGFPLTSHIMFAVIRLREWGHFAPGHFISVHYSRHNGEQLVTELSGELADDSSVTVKVIRHYVSSDLLLVYGIRRNLHN